ncbi:MAG TPA: type I DNA topoisomerase [Synergistaceae bacterium]|nr:type I DNA topoisomerase [Synergistaceae bacterium]HPJ24903.1 type I DNA topoisomerase [Synergistaceae bacterium]HPQ36998.1 type I DNA topoisomerase [Synergistaceae bacterium]
MPSKKTLVIVESPAKAKTLGKILGKNYAIAASMGHVRDLPKSKIGVDIDNDFEPQYIQVRGKAKIVKELKSAAAKAGKVLLAADPDREGEAIAWHLAHILSVNTEEPCRVRMYEITPKGVKEAVKNPEPLSMDKVYAQQARRILDRVMGYSLSPLLWKKIQPRLSAGRVQSVALRLIAEREREILAFVPEEYWLVDLDLASEDGRTYQARLSKKKGKNYTVKTEEEAREIEALLKGGSVTVTSFKEKDGYRSPLPPFRTSTLQQEASRRLGYAPRKTMRVAQQLYEGVDLPGRGPVGLITYMRTDSLRLSGDALGMARSFIEENWKKEYLPKSPNVYASKGKSQDAHEAIRPTDVTLEPKKIKASLTSEQFKLYDLIWRRFVACQMNKAHVKNSTLEVEGGIYLFKQSGSRLIFEGWGAVWPLELKEGIIAPAEEGESLDVAKVLSQQRFTNPPARYGESALIKALEDNGIGRPSTYASIIQTLYDRGYVDRNEEKRMQPSELGLIVNDFLVEHFPRIVNVDFTATMEEDLDDIEEGTRGWKEVVREFWSPFSSNLAKAEENAKKVTVPPREIGENCPECGSPLVIKRGRFGEFIACSGYPDCKYSRPILKTIGVSCPKCGIGEVVRRRSKKGGRFFYGCSRFPECDFASWAMPTGEKCPVCGGPMVTKGKNKTPFCMECSESGKNLKKEKSREKKS